MGFASRLLFVLALVGGFAARAQEPPELVFLDTQIETRPDSFGGEATRVTGELFNNGLVAVGNVRVFVEAYAADDGLIGEGFGYLVNACGTALLDYALPAGRTQAYEAPFEVFAAGEVAAVKLSLDAEAIAPALTSPPVVSPLVTTVAADEVVQLEWLDDETLIFGVGCADAVFTELDWWQYSLPDHALKAIRASGRAPRVAGDDRAQRGGDDHAIGRVKA